MAAPPSLSACPGLEPSVDFYSALAFRQDEVISLGKRLIPDN